MKFLCMFYVLRTPPVARRAVAVGWAVMLVPVAEEGLAWEVLGVAEASGIGAAEEAAAAAAIEGASSALPVTLLHAETLVSIESIMPRRN